MANYSGVYKDKWELQGPQLALTPPSKTNTGFWHSGGENHPFIEFSMSEEAEVNSVKIVDRLDGNKYANRFEEVEVRVDTKNIQNPISCGVQSYNGSTTYIYNCPPNTRGNHITIKKHGTTKLLHINNVEVSIKSKGTKQQNIVPVVSMIIPYP